MLKNAFLRGQNLKISSQLRPDFTILRERGRRKNEKSMHTFRVFGVFYEFFAKFFLSFDDFLKVFYLICDAFFDFVVNGFLKLAFFNGFLEAYF